MRVPPRPTRRRTAALAAVVAGLAVCVTPPAEAAPTEAACHTVVRGSVATATCFNPDADPDHVQLHVECRRWWDPDVDSRPVAVDPIRTVTLSDRCWMDVHSAWVTHG
ncbi:hypothetical protein [Streptomyces sp. NPDC057702]|uniref:hypothetical protein n=1 Tax=unclassified Streptomyces TaxID=2593676 RepID=UPI0036B558EE